MNRILSDGILFVPLVRSGERLTSELSGSESRGSRRIGRLLFAPDWEETGMTCGN